MNTADFLRLILPSKGYYFLAVPLASGGYKHKAFTDVEKLADAALYASGKGVNTYMACSSYEQPEYIGADGKKHWRTKDNAIFTRSQWMDMDGDKATNLRALKAFCAETGIPRPNILVDSGNGIHTYWIFDRDVDAKTWRKCASLFKSIAAHFDLAQLDTTRTSDVTSVLRPHGTVNDKTHKGLGVKPVKIVGTVIEKPIAFSDWVRALVDVQRKYEVSVPKQTEAKVNINSDLGGGASEYPPASAVTIAEHCAQIKFFRDFKGEGQTEPVWRSCLGLVKHTVEGVELAHEWSSGHTDYEASKCQEKLDNWNAGPTTCAKFKQDNPTGCAGCPHTVTTPMFLGQVAPEPVVHIEEFNPTTEEVVVDEAPVFSEEMLKRFRPTKDGISARKEDDEGVASWVLICDKWVYPYQYYCDVDDGSQWKLRIAVRVRPGEWKDAEITAKALYSGGVTLRAELGSKALLGATPGNDKLLEFFMRTAADDLQAAMVETAMHEHMGWQEDRSFLVGSKRYSPDGEVREVVLGKSLRAEQKSFVQVGDLPRYTELINHAYNRPKHEPYQFTWMAGFASPLIELMCNEPVGIVFSAWSPESGFGKSTAAKLAAGLWHDPTKVVGASRTTPYALYVNAGHRRNLPLVVDEISTWDATKISDFGYDYSSGQAKQQGDSKTGGLRDNSHLNWTNCVITTSNRSVMETMAAHSTNQCIPQMMRVFEYRFDANHNETMATDEGRTVMAELMQMSGVAGPVFMRSVVKNQDTVHKMLDSAYLMFARESKLPKDARFWLYGASASWVAFNISKKLGLHSFNGSSYKAWILSQLANLDTVVNNARTDVVSMFGDMVSDLQGGIIVTMNEGHGNGTIATLAPNHRLPTGEVTGRLIIGNKRLAIKFAAIKQWCKTKNISTVEMKHALKEKGWLVGTGQVYLAVGLPMAVAKTSVWMLDWEACSSNVRLVSINGAQVEVPDVSAAH